MIFGQLVDRYVAICKFHDDVSTLRLVDVAMLAGGEAQQESLRV